MFMTAPITRNISAVLGPPMSCPMSTSKPVRLASRMVVRTPAFQFDVVVLVIPFILALMGNRAPANTALPYEYRLSKRGLVWGDHPISTAAPPDLLDR